MSRRHWAFSFVIVACFAIAGCAKRETVAEAGIRMGVLVLGNAAEPETLDPQLITSFTDGNIALSLFEGLTALDETTSQPVAAAAEKWAVSADGLTWTFHIREGAKWSNGDPLTADDFIKSWRRMLSPSIAAEYAYLLFPIKNAEAYNSGKLTDASQLGLASPDPLTLVITLERPTPYLAALAAQASWYPINVKCLDKFGGMATRSSAWTRPGNLVGNGPFILKEWVSNAKVTVVRNPQYWDAASVSLNRIEFIPIDSPDVEEHDFRAGQVHITYSMPAAKIAAYKQSHPDELRIDPFVQTFFLRYNVTKGPLADARVRRALSLAIDREAIAHAVLQGAFPPAYSLTPAGCGPYTPDASIRKDYDQARMFLAEAGYKDGKGLPAFEVLARNDEVQPRVLEAIQAEWKKELGVTITINAVEQKTWVQNQQTLNYTISMAGWVGDFPDPVTFLDLFVTDGGNNWTGFGNKAYDALIADAAATTDTQARMQDFQKAEALLLQEAPITPLYFGARTYLIDKHVKGWLPSLLGNHRYSRVSFSTP